MKSDSIKIRIWKYLLNIYRAVYKHLYDGEGEIGADKAKTKGNNTQEGTVVKTLYS